MMRAERRERAVVRILAIRGRLAEEAKLQRRYLNEGNRYGAGSVQMRRRMAHNVLRQRSRRTGKMLRLGRHAARDR